jgi:hypothetical protein
VPSIRDTHERHQALIKQADEVWNTLADELAKLIPPSMEKFAREMGWIKSEGSGKSELPKFLKGLAENAYMDDCNREKIRQDELREYGFASFQELRVGLNDLSRAWAGLVRISLDTRDGYKWKIFFYADEFSKAPLCMEGSGS